MEIQEVFEGFLILRSVNPNQNPGVVIRYLDKIFGDGFGNFQVECETLMKLHRVFQVYKRFCRLVPEEAPVILIENLENIFKLESSKPSIEDQQLSIQNEKEAQGNPALQGQGQGSVNNFPIVSTSKPKSSSNGNSNRVEIQVSQCKFCLRPFPNEYFLKKHELNFCGLKRTASQNISLVSMETLSKPQDSSAASNVSSCASTLLFRPNEKAQTSFVSPPKPKSKQKSTSDSSPSPSKSEAVVKWLQVQNDKEDGNATKSYSGSSSSSAEDGFFPDFPDSDSESSISACTTLTSASDPLSLPVKNGKNPESSQNKSPNENENDYQEEEETGNAKENAEKEVETEENLTGQVMIYQENSRFSFQCIYCAKKYANLRGLNIHIKVHTGDYDFECEHCFKQFAFQSQLKIHMRVHTKKFPCRVPECTKTFNTKGRRNGHERLHKNRIQANESNPNPSQNLSKTKGMTFKLKSKSNGNGKKLLKKSRKILTKKIPSRISKFHQMNNNIQTMAVPPKKIYECPVCKKIMASHQTLRCHVRAQHSNRSFPCRFCTRTFKYSSNRSSHEKTHKNEERRIPESSENNETERKRGNEHFGSFTCRFENCLFKTYDRRILAHHLCQEHTQKLLSNPLNQVEPTDPDF